MLRLSGCRIGRQPLSVLGDVSACTVFALLELPVGVITAQQRGPFFLWLLWRQG